MPEKQEKFSSLRFARPGQAALKDSWPRPLVVTIIAAFVLRVLVYHWADVTIGLPRPPNAPYAWELGNIARAIVTGKGFSSPLPVETGPTGFLTPVFPYFVALLFKLFGIYSRAAELGIIYFNAAVSALTCWPLYRIGQRIGDGRLGLLAARIWTFLPTAVFCPVTWLWDASFLAFLVALIFWATLELAESPRSLPWAGYGALWAFTAMTNPAPVPLLPFYLGWAALRLRQPQGIRLRRVALSLAVFVVGISPWMIRGYVVLGKFFPFRSVGGITLDAANNATSGGSWVNPHSPYDNPVEREKYQSMGEIAYADAAQRRAMAFIRSQPRLYAQYVLRRIGDTWIGPWIPILTLFPGVNWEKQEMFYLYACRVFSLLTFVGLWFAFRTRLPAADLFFVSLLVFPLVYYLTQTMLRYRHPIDPLMAVLASYAIAHPATLLARRWNARGVPAATPGNVSS